MASLWGVMTILSAMFCGGFVVGVHVERNLGVLEDIKREREYSIELLDCENKRIREVLETEERYKKEINELNKKLNDCEQRKD